MRWLRDLVALPLLLLVMAALVLSAWPFAIEPPWLQKLGERAYDTFERVGVRAGMPVFAGGPGDRSSVVRAHCIEVVGTDASGARVPIYPEQACPPEGLRWRPETEGHLLFHWMLKVRRRQEPAYLLAMGDHFCHAEPGRMLRSVEITQVRHTIDYETGAPSSRAIPLGSVECRP